jgi:hypothetical protein
VKALLLLLLFLPLQALARDQSPAIGFEHYHDHLTLVSSDFLHFKQAQLDAFGVQRYGFGGAQMEIGESNFAINARAHNGITMMGWNSLQDGFGPHVGLEIFNGEIRMNSNREFNNFFLYQPAIAIGTQGKTASFKYTLNYRRGFSASNYYIENGWGPRYDWMEGIGAYFQWRGVSFAGEESRFHGLTKRILDFGGERLHLMLERDEIEDIKLIAYRTHF